MQQQFYFYISNKSQWLTYIMSPLQEIIEKILVKYLLGLIVFTWTVIMNYRVYSNIL